MASSSKSNNMNKAIVFVALFGLLLGVLARSCVQVEEEINGSHFEQQFGKVCRNIQDGLVTLTVKYLHFFISKWLQLRYLPPLFPAPSTFSWPFWVAFTQSISSMPDNPIQ